ncbi:MAG: ATP synthase F1 subunit gamma [Bdellovibrionales bacterium]|nr:ATP synthase F1 subunit gamma [Bdellovibrionales bacterium]
MAGLKDIKRRIKSVSNTKKITYAMKLVSAAKLRKAQDSVNSARQYTDALGELVGQVLSVTDTSELTHPLMEERAEVRRVRLIVAGGSRGLCGAFNANVNKQVDKALKDIALDYPNAERDVYVLGKKPREHVVRKRYTCFKKLDDLPEEALAWPIEEVAQDVEDAFLKGEVDRVFILYMRFESAMSQTPTLEQLLPLQAVSTAGDESNDEASLASSLTLFEPSAEKVFESLVPRILRTRIQQAALDTKASEHGSRMVAMDAATKNAGELAKSLTLTHNKLRQGAITSELLDIIGGAEALSD